MAIQLPTPVRRHGSLAGLDLRELERRLAEAVDGEVRFDVGSRGTYATDASNFRQVPLGVGLPRTVAAGVAAVAVCAQMGAPIVSRGGGTSLAGQTCNVAIVMDMSKYYNKVLELDIAAKTVKVQPGIVLDHMKAYTEKHGLTFGPDPSTHNHCTIGGMLGNNSCGTHSIMSALYGYGAKMENNITEMTILTYDGIRMTVGPTSKEEFARIVAEGGRKAEIYTKMLISIRGKTTAKEEEKIEKISNEDLLKFMDSLGPGAKDEQ